MFIIIFIIMFYNITCFLIIFYCLIKYYFYFFLNYSLLFYTNAYIVTVVGLVLLTRHAAPPDVLPGGPNE